MDGNMSSQSSTSASSGPQYKEYLRTQFIYKDFKDLNLEPFEALVSRSCHDVRQYSAHSLT